MAPAVWMASVTRIVNPHLPTAEADFQGTLSAEPAIDARWKYALSACFPNPGDADDAVAPDLGLGTPDGPSRRDRSEWNDGAGATEGGRRSLALVLCAARGVLGIECCPPLPDVAAVLLTHATPSYAYAMIREMVNDASHFLPVSRRDYYSWCMTYSHFAKRMFPAVHAVMSECGALDPEGGLDPIFGRFFATLLKREDVLHFVDVFAIEGCKAVFRLALSLLRLVRRGVEKLMLTDATSFWNEVRYRTLDPAFSLRKHLDKMYPKWGKMAKRYPRRRLLRRAMKHYEGWAAENMPVYVDRTPPRPMGHTDGGCVLARPAGIRSDLARWLPHSLRSARLDLVYSTEVHGRSLSALYERCRRSKNTVVLVEALPRGGGSATIGMFAPRAWIPSASSYGDGECLLFRASPDPHCWEWKPDLRDDASDVEGASVREQFMVARRDYIAMGANVDGTNGLRIDADLAAGESHRAAGFRNEPLPGHGTEGFDVGVLEVYQLVREVDGKAVGHREDLVWDLSGL